MSWRASHDLGLKGWDRDLLLAVVDLLSRRGRVLTSTEGELSAELTHLHYTGETSAFHHILGHCQLYVGESATMASEAVVMGVPAIYATPSYCGYVS